MDGFSAPTRTQRSGHDRRSHPRVPLAPGEKRATGSRSGQGGSRVAQDGLRGRRCCRHVEKVPHILRIAAQDDSRERQEEGKSPRRVHGRQPPAFGEGNEGQGEGGGESKGARKSFLSRLSHRHGRPPPFPAKPGRRRLSPGHPRPPLATPIHLHSRAPSSPGAPSSPYLGRFDVRAEEGRSRREEGGQGPEGLRPERQVGRARGGRGGGQGWRPEPGEGQPRGPPR